MIYTLGIDISTQSITAVILDFKNKEIVQECSLSYTSDKRFIKYELDSQTKALPETVSGLVEQPPLLFLDALDNVLTDIHNALQNQKANMQDIVSVSVSAQQHGHVYLNKSAYYSFLQLSKHKSNHSYTLSDVFRDSFSYPRAPIWMTSASHLEADEIREYIGNTQKMIELSGSNSPARFTGAIIRYIAKNYWHMYQDTYAIRLISNFISGILSANIHVPVDWGNGSGMSLMDYQKKQWSPLLVEAVCQGLSDTDDTTNSNISQNLLHKIGSLQSPLSIAGTIAPYFVHKYSFHPQCKVTIGSGDNPQSKVIIPNDLLSLGTSFVFMSSVSEKNNSITSINKMYDGLARPFIFCCRTNGALLWDRVRAENSSLTLQDYENILHKTPIGTYLMHWQALEESFPPSASFRKSVQFQDATKIYPAIIDTTIAIMAHYTKNIISHSTPLYITGGATQSFEISKRVATLFNKEVTVVNDSGAAVGAAVSSLRAINTSQNEQEFYSTFVLPLIQVKATIRPNNQTTTQIFLPRAIQEYEQLIKN